MVWTVNLLPLAGGAAINTATPFKAGRVTWALDGPNAVELDLRASDVADGRWLYGQRRVLVKDGAGTTRFQGWLERLERGSGTKLPGAASVMEWRAAGRGLAAHLAERVVHGDFNRVATVKTTIATDLIAHMVAQTDDKSGFTAGTITGVAQSDDKYYCDGDVIEDAIKELAENAGTAGFDWEIDATGAFNAWVGGRGTNRTGTYSISPSTSIDWADAGDVTDLRTYVTALGGEDDNSNCGAALVVDFTAERTTYGRKESVVSSDVEDVTKLDNMTTEELRSRVASHARITNTWIEGSAKAQWPFGTVWLGDTVVAHRGTELGGDLNVRLISISVTFESKFEFVEMEWEAA